MLDLEEESKPDERTGIQEKYQLTTDGRVLAMFCYEHDQSEQMPWRPIGIAAGGNASAIIAVWEQSVADSISEEREKQRQDNAALLMQQMAELEKRKEALDAGVAPTTVNEDKTDA